MKVRKLNEVRLNNHQQHLEDLILFGKEGIEELNDKIDKFIRRFESSNRELNLTQKIDGCLAPETLIKTTEGDISFSQLINEFNLSGKVYKGFGKDDKTDEVKEVDLQLPRVINGDKEWCTIEFDNNSFITCTIDHPFKVDDRYEEAYKLDSQSKIDVI